MNKLQTLLQNPHTTWAAVVYAVAKIVAELGAVWNPRHAEQWKNTSNLIEGAAVFWGLTMAGDATPKEPSQPPAGTTTKG